MKRRVNGITKTTNNRFLNMYELDMKSDNGKHSKYFVASRAEKIEDLKITLYRFREFGTNKLKESSRSMLVISRLLLLLLFSRIRKRLIRATIPMLVSSSSRPTMRIGTAIGHTAMSLLQRTFLTSTLTTLHLTVTPVETAGLSRVSTAIR